MTLSIEISSEEDRLLDSIVEFYVTREREVAKRLAAALVLLLNDTRLAPFAHSYKGREKDPSHLREKLKRKLISAKVDGVSFSISPENLFERITDLAGVRLLHLHTSQFPKINEILQGLLIDEGYKVIEGPEARTWDIEYEAFFQKHGIHTVSNNRMYTSVHYIIETGGKTKRTAEIQVRTLAEELWGEVDHALNYPRRTEVLACEEQIKVLARLTSSCTRLVDSIFTSDDAARRLGAASIGQQIDRKL